MLSKGLEQWFLLFRVSPFACQDELSVLSAVRILDVQILDVRGAGCKSCCAQPADNQQFALACSTDIVSLVHHWQPFPGSRLWMSTGPGPGVGLGNRPTMGPYGGPTVAFAGIGQPLYDYSGPQQHPYASAAATTLLGSPLNTPSSAFAQQASLMGFDHGIAEDGEVIPLEDMEPWGGSLVAPGHSNLYVKNLPEDVTEQQLEALFRVYGGVDSCRLVRNLKTGASRGYGFVRYKT